MSWGPAAKGEFMCRRCGLGATHLHHAIPRSRLSAGVDELLNGLPLCGHCHDFWHAGNPIERDVFRPHEWAWLAAHESMAWLDERYPEPDPDPF